MLLVCSLCPFVGLLFLFLFRVSQVFPRLRQQLLASVHVVHGLSRMLAVEALDIIENAP